MNYQSKESSRESKAEGRVREIEIERGMEEEEEEEYIPAGREGPEGLLNDVSG